MSAVVRRLGRDGAGRPGSRIRKEDGREGPVGRRGSREMPADETSTGVIPPRGNAQPEEGRERSTGNKWPRISRRDSIPEEFRISESNAVD